MPFLKSLKLDGILSFPPGSEAIPLTPLNVLIGPNGSGKSNLIAVINLLHALPTGFVSAIREGGGVREWLWKGDEPQRIGTVNIEIYKDAISLEGIYGALLDESASLSYSLLFGGLGQRVQVLEEILWDPGKDEAYYQNRNGSGVISAKVADSGKLYSRVRDKSDSREIRALDAKSIKPDESVFTQFKDPQIYPELTQLGLRLGEIRSFQDWTIGSSAQVRKPQPTDLPNDSLISDSSNLGLVLNRLEHSNVWSEFNGYLSRFLPRFQRFSTRIEGGTVQFYLHEEGLKAPISAARLSDGTIRFMAILASLLSPQPPPLTCIEEPELGLHPDAVALLASLLHEASSRTQLIVTTHSDALVSALTEYADSVLVCEYKGGTVIRRLDASKLRFWLDKYNLGEIWRIGEIGGNL